MKQTIKGLWVPLLTPLYNGRFDKASALSILHKIEPHIDGVVPCLSSGEGAEMSDELWEEVIDFVTKNTAKPVAAGILRDSIEEIVVLAHKAKQLGCFAIVTPLLGKSIDEQEAFCRSLSDKVSLPIILYNTEVSPIGDLDTLQKIGSLPNIIALKDSSGNQAFFDEMVKAHQSGALDISVFQGMENQLLQSVGCAGYIIALANAEPELCKEMLDKPSTEINQEILRKWEEWDLGSQKWYVSLKRILLDQKLLKSLETL